MTISLSSLRQETQAIQTYYVADITLSSTDYLKTALAQDTLGTNITETTSSIASSKNAFLPLTVTITALIRQVM